MTTRFIHRILLFALFLLSASTVLYAQDELCTDGILLFREDFGGNDTSDPAVGHTPVSGMTSGYQQVYTLQTSDPGTGMGAGRYLVAKRGYRNSSNSNYSVWHIMDDHTHFGDTTRGYLLEIDGLGSGNDVFYSTVIDGLCAGSRLTFSAYVANLTTAGQYNGWRNRNYVHPKLSFVITHPVTGAELARYNTDTISHDWSNYPKSWRETADWQLVGMNFTVPEGIDSVRLSIRNNASGSSTGNDFALDDIEIRLCLTPDTIKTDTLVCDTTSRILWRDSLYQIADTLRDTIFNSCGIDSVYYILSVKTEHCDPPEPTLCTSGILLFREDFGGNDPDDPRLSTTPVEGMSYTLSTSGMGSGRYMVTKSGYCNGDTTGWTLPGADLSGKRSQWYIQDDHTYPNDYSRGYFMEIDGNGGNQQFYQTEIYGLCEGIELTFSAYVANVFTWFQYDWYTRNRGPVIAPCLKFVLTNPQTGATLAEKNTKEIPFDENLPAKTDWQYSSQWHLVGMNFTVPVGVDAIRLSIYNNVTNGNGNDFALDDIEIRLCAPPVTIEGETEVCANKPTTLTANFANDGTFAEPLEYKWWHSTDSVTWTEMSGFSGGILSFDAIQKADSGWYKVAVSGDGNIESVYCRAVSDPFRLKVNECEVIVQIISPDSVCPNDPYVFRTEIENESLLPTPVQYQWWYRSPEQPGVWTKMVGGNQRELQISSFKTQHVGWYKLMVAGSGDMDDENKRKESEEFFVTFKKCEPDLCLSGTLLYRDDFGGNDPSESRVGSTPVPGMTYRQLLSDKFGQMGNSAYLVAKEGYCNGDTAALRRRYGYLPGWGSQWILQDDHTYPNDRSRGYLVEIDGAGTSTPFYSTTISDLCLGAKLTFSAYVVNVHFYEQVQKFYRVGGYNYVYPRLKFVLKNPQTDQILASQSTGDIQPDVNKSWNIHLRESAEWQLVGMEFIVPEGVESVQMFIYNDVDYNGTGNDFALDDIEIHLCAPPVTIEGETEVCANKPTTLTANFANDGTFAEPLEYKWWHSTDSVTWTEMSGFSGGILSFDAIQKADSGWYKVAVSGDGNIESVNCRAVSDPFRLKVNECTEDLCIDGILLFREDFGGNNPSDPKISTTPVPGMSYTQVTSDVLGSMGAGKYLVTKQGYCNGNGTSQWHLQDDHTHFGDLTRGYFMEIDGRAGSDAFYRTTIDHLCEGIELTFSAYVANVMTWGMYVGRPGMYAYPRLKFVLTDPTSNTELATYDTGDIPFDSTFIGDNMCWQQSVEWRLVGMNFIVPVGVESVQLSIYNNVSNSNGNDFAIDDIEVHLCMTPDTIRTDTTVCDTLSQIQWRDKIYNIADTLRDTLFSTCGFDSIYYILHVETEHCEVPEPPFCMGGTLLFREDFGGNDPNDPMVSKTPMPGISSRYQQDVYYSAGYLAGMHYIIAKQGHPESDFHDWHIMDDHTYPNDPTRGYLFETNSRANILYTNYIYQKEVAGLCAGMQLSFSAYFANVVTAREFKTVPFLSYSYPKFVFLVTDARTGEQLARYNTDTIGHDWSLYNIPDSWQYSAQWHLEGMKFTIPEGVDKVTVSIIDDPTQYGNAEGDDYAVDDIELHLCSNVEYQTVDTTICDTLLPFSWRGIEWIKADTIGKIYKDVQGNDSLYLVYSLRTIHCPYPPVSVSQDTTICDTLSQIKWHDKLFPITHEIHDTVYDAYGYDSVYYNLRVTRYHCPYPPVTISSDTTICDTLAQIAWRDKIYAVTSELRDTLYDAFGADSVYFVLNISTETCCPYMIREQEHHYTCDTLMPYVWHGFGDSAVIAEEGEHIIEIPSKRWPDCIAYRITVILNVEHCERLYPLIVNKYNWQLLLDNVTLRRLFPDRTARSYQWYKDDLPIPGATDDDYSEQNELHGRFQLRIELDNNQTIWSNILEINVQRPTTNDQLQVHIFNCHGLPVREDHLTRGIYLYRYQQGDTIWTEKRLIP